MSDYLYRLAPYQGPQSRYTCPSCQKPRQFVRYIHRQTGIPLNELVGRCNREVKCGYHYTPQQYLAEHRVKSHNVLHNITPIQHPKPPRYIDHRLFNQILRAYDHDVAPANRSTNNERFVLRFSFKPNMNHEAKIYRRTNHQDYTKSQGRLSSQSIMP